MYICLFTYNYKISTAILDLWLPVSSGNVVNSIIEKFVPENIRVAVGILFLASLEAKIPLRVVLPPLYLFENNLYAVFG